MSNARFFTFTLKHVARAVELWNQINATSVQIKHCQTQTIFNINFFINDHFHLLIQWTASFDLLCILMYFCLFFPNNLCTLPKTIDLTDFLASERSDIGLMSELCYMFLSLMWRTPHLPNRKIAQMRRVFFEELNWIMNCFKW